jgi:hypothetical protein
MSARKINVIIMGSGPLRGPFAMEPEPRNNRFSHLNVVLLLALNQARGPKIVARLLLSREHAAP